MAGTATGTTGANIKRTIVTQAMIVIAALGVSYILITRVVDASRRLITPVASNSSEAVLAHCAQFITLAKSRYGDDWKFRIDPRDTICSPQIQHAWEQQWQDRTPPIEQPSRPTFVETVSAAPTPAAEQSFPGGDTRARNPETYCLNVMSLARTKYGVDWKTKVSPEEAAGCEAEFR